MNKTVSYNKMSKKKKKEFNSLKRNTWTISPVTRTDDGIKVYNRAKEKQNYHRFSSVEY